MSLSRSLEFRHFRRRYLLSVKYQALIRPHHAARNKIYFKANSGKTGSQPNLSPQGTGVSEPIVDPEADQIRRQTVVGEGEPITFAGKIDEEVFGLDGPVWEQAHRESGAHRPADMKIALAQAADIDVATPIGKPERAVEQDVIEGEAAASARRP